MFRTQDLGVSLAGWVLLVSCAAHVEPKVEAAPVGACSERATPSSAPEPPVSHAAAGDRLTQAVLDGIPRPKPGQFDTPERVLGFLFETIASRDLAASLAAFPVVEHADRVTLKDYVQYTYSFSPERYPLDDDHYGRLNQALAGYMAGYYWVALRILTDGAQAPSAAPGGNSASFLQAFEGPPLKGLKVVSMTEVSADARPKLSSIDRAIGVTEKRAYQTRLEIEQRKLDVISTVGRIDGDWRVLFLAPNE